MRLRIKVDKGKLVEGKNQLGALLHSLDGDYILTCLDLKNPNTIEEWRKLYFALRDVLHESVETGYTKNELHDAIKQHIIPEMWENEEGWFDVSDGNWLLTSPLTTKKLTEVGWKEYVKRFREFAMDEFEIYL